MLCNQFGGDSISAFGKVNHRDWIALTHVLISGLAVAAAMLWHAGAAHAQNFSSNVDAEVQIDEGGAGQTDQEDGPTKAVAAFSDDQHSGSASGVIDLTSPVKFHAAANASVAANSFGQTSSGVSLTFSDNLHGQANASLTIQITNGDFHFYVLEQVTARVATGQGTERLTLDLANPLTDHAAQQAYGSGNMLRIDLDEIDDLALFSGGLDAINSMTVTAGADAFGQFPVYNSDLDFSDTADLSYFYLTDQDGNPVDGLTIIGDSGIQYPVNQPLPAPEPSALVLIGIGAACFVARHATTMQSAMQTAF
jgi:hypothetical protein